MYRHVADMCAVPSDMVAVVGKREDQFKLTLFNLTTRRQAAVKVSLQNYRVSTGHNRLYLVK